MAQKILFRRGLKTDLPTLSEGEIGFCTDTKEVFIGTNSGNKLIGGGGTGSGILSFNTLTEAQNALPTGSNQPIWITSENSWYYWDGPVVDTTPPTVTVLPVGGTYNSNQSVTLTANKTSTIYYTTDGTTPTTNSNVYTGSITVSATTNIKYFAVDTAGNQSTVQSVTYTIDKTAPVITASSSGGTFTSAQNVTLSSNETGTTIYYTLDGSTPTTSSSVYSSALNISSTSTLKFFGKDAAGNQSAVQSISFTINAPDTTAPTVTINPAAGTFTSAQSVTLTANEQATIYYTLDGSTPTTASVVYSSPISISSTTTIKYFAKDTAGNQSAVQTATYTINIQTTDTTPPIITASPTGGTYTSTQSVTLSSNEVATIYYTTDGTDPKTSGTKQTYNSPITVSATTTLKYYGKDSSGNESTVQTQTYTLNVSSAPGTTLISDTFNRTDSTTLGIADTGQTWTNYSGPNGTYLLGIKAGQAYPSGGTYTSGVNKWRRFSKITVPSNNFSLELDTITSTTAAGVLGIGIRVNGTDDNMLYVRKSQAVGQTSSQYTVVKFPSGGSVTTIGTGTVLAGANDHIKIEHYSDGTIKVYINGTLDITCTDTSIAIGTNTIIGLGSEIDGNYFDNLVVKQL